MVRDYDQWIRDTYQKNIKLYAAFDRDWQGDYSSIDENRQQNVHRILEMMKFLNTMDAYPPFPDACPRETLQIGVPFQRGRVTDLGS